MAFSKDTRARYWFVVIHIKNMIKAGLKPEQYKDEQFVADFFIQMWEKSGKGRQGLLFALMLMADIIYIWHV